MNLKPILQTKLYGMDLIFDEIVNLFNSNKIPNNILFSGSKGSGKSTIAYHFINYIFSANEDHSYDIESNKIDVQNRSFKLVSNGLHPNFHLIDLVDNKKNIEISQIRNMINYTNKSSFNNLPKLILIDNIEHLNINSLNALLKIIEEPNKNVFFMLIHNDNKRIKKTLISRCLTFKVHLSFDETIKISNLLLNDNIFDLINYDFIDYYEKTFRGGYQRALDLMFSKIEKTFEVPPRVITPSFSNWLRSPETTPGTDPGWSQPATGY